MSHKPSTALRNVGTGADLVGFATLQGVDPASPAYLLDARTSTRSSFARHEFGEICGLVSKSGAAELEEKLTDQRRVQTLKEKINELEVQIQHEQVQVNLGESVTFVNQKPEGSNSKQ